MNPAPKFQPALFGGLFIGVLSALPIINIGNCCCLWVIGGGVLATYLMQQNHPYPIAAADGALVDEIGHVRGTRPTTRHHLDLVEDLEDSFGSPAAIIVRDLGSTLTLTRFRGRP